MNTVLFCGIEVEADETESFEGEPDIPDSNPITRILSTRSIAIAVLDSWCEAGKDVPLLM